MFPKQKNMELAHLFLGVKNHFILTDFGIMCNINFQAQLLEVKAYSDNIYSTSWRYDVSLWEIKRQQSDKEKIKSELDACLLTDEELADESWKKESSDSWPVHRLESDLDLNHNHIPMTNDGKKVGRNDKIKLIKL